MSRGLVGVIANDSARYSLFASCIDQLHLPDGWKKEWVIGGDWCDARNQLCQMVLDEGHSHLWFMDDDHAFPPEILTKLLAHDVPLVTPVCLTRVYPFNPVQYVYAQPEKKERWKPEWLDKHGAPKKLPLPLSQIATDGLVEVAAAGCAGMLIRRDVIEGIQNRSWDNTCGWHKDFTPWFEYTDKSEDVLFCEKAVNAGFTLHTDLSVRLGHITTAVVWPAVKEGQWTTGINVGRDLSITVDTFEGFLAKQQPWIWELRHDRGELEGEVVVRLKREPDEPTNWQPSPLEIPDGVLQWWLDDGDGFREVGDPFSYEIPA